jgi:hypothetical protein
MSGMTAPPAEPTTGRSLPRRVLSAALWLLATLVCLLSLVTVLRVTDGLTGSTDVLHLGTARVQSCTEYGPVSQWGFGTTHGCTAEIRWDDGRTETREFVPGQLSPADMNTEVPVFESSDGRTLAPSPGRNDSAQWTLLGRDVFVVLALLLVFLVIRTLVALFSSSKEKDTDDKQWPVTRRDKASVPITKPFFRSWGLSAIILGAMVLEGVAAIPLLDAPRADPFVSPWPVVEEAWLFNPPSLFFAILGLPVALVFLVMPFALRTDQARVIRYGESYLNEKLPGKKKRKVNAELERLAANRGKQVRTGAIVAGVFIASGIWGFVEVALTIPGDAPALVWFAGARDAIILLAIGVVLLATIEPPIDRFRRLLGLHRTQQSHNGGTETVHFAS